MLISVGISFGVALDASETRCADSPLANECRRPSSMGAPPMSEARELARIVFDSGGG